MTFRCGKILQKSICADNAWARSCVSPPICGIIFYNALLKNSRNGFLRPYGVYSKNETVAVNVLADCHIRFDDANHKEYSREKKFVMLSLNLGIQMIPWNCMTTTGY